MSNATLRGVLTVGISPNALIAMNLATTTLQEMYARTVTTQSISSFRDRVVYHVPLKGV